MVQQLNAPRQGTVPVQNMQPLPVSGSKFQYVRLVAAPGSQTQTASGMCTVRENSLSLYDSLTILNQEE